MRYLPKKLCVFAFMIMLPACIYIMPAYAVRQQQIVAIVNEDAISQKDLNDRVKLIMASSGLPNTKEIRDKLGQQIINSLIDEQIMLQEARNMKFKVSQDEIEKGFNAIAAQNKIKPEQFKAMLRRNGIDVSTLYRQIKANIAWSKVVQAKLRPRVVVTDRDVDDVMQRLKRNIGKSEYLVAEIFLPISDPKSEQKTKSFANRLVREIKSGNTSFFKLAQQFSKSAGASKGGNLGWVREGQISQELEAALKNMEKNQVSYPIRSQNGYHILFLRDKRVIKEENLPSRDQIFYTLGTERLDKLQRGYLLDIKASSFIENRIVS